MSLPEEFATYTRRLFGEERWQRYLSAFDEPAPVSIRLNPFKNVELINAECRMQNAESEAAKPIQHSAFRIQHSNKVPWCRHAFYLSERPNFTLDPLLHAGAYYVQEASSMFLDQVMRQHVTGSVRMLDLCAAPGGKSTLARAALPEGSLLMTNEPDRRRANILMENMIKQGHRDVIVTNSFPRDYRRAGIPFDVVLADVPCSGEGMFRKDSGAIAEWSTQNVMRCAELQRSIVADIWDCLQPGGLLIYSTCTFNLREDEENVRWIAEELGAELLTVETEPEWGITGSLLDGFSAPVYRFIPGITRGEGLFMAVLRKAGNAPAQAAWRGGLDGLRVLYDGRQPQDAAPKSEKRGRDGKPRHAPAGREERPGVSHAEAMQVGNNNNMERARVELSLDDALRYLRHEALLLPPDTPRGHVIVTYGGLPLGFVKNIGSRANNLYPQEWRIRNV